MNKKLIEAADVQGLAANNETTETGTMSNVQVNNEVESNTMTEKKIVRDDVDFFKGLINKQPTREMKVSLIDLLRDIWDYYDNFSWWVTFGMKDEKFKFLEDCIQNPLCDATDEVAKEIGYESLKERNWRKLREAWASRANKTSEVEVDDRLPF